MKRCARSILDVRVYMDNKHTSTVKLFERLQWLPIDVRIKYYEGVQTYNIIHGNAQEYLSNSLNYMTHDMNTRNSQKSHVLLPPRTKLKTGQRAFKFRAATLWNSQYYSSYSN